MFFYLCVLILYFTKYECIIAISEVKETSPNRLSTTSTAAVGGGLNEARLKSHDPVFAAVEHLDLVFCSEHTGCQHQGGD